MLWTAELQKLPEPDSSAVNGISFYMGKYEKYPISKSNAVQPARKSS